MTDILVFNKNVSPGTLPIQRENHRWIFDDRSKDDIVFYVDDSILDRNKIGKIKIAWIFEPEEINKRVYDYIRKNYNEFDYIFTWDRELSKLNNKFIFFPYGTAWIGKDEYVMYPKSKLCSIVASAKNFMPGHALRHEIISKFKNMFDTFGYGYNPIPTLQPAFKDYMFTIAVENVYRDCNFSEKIVTPILCGTIPIYYGCSSVGEFLDIRGILQFTTINELEAILATLTPEKYQEMLPYAQINFELVKKFDLSDNTAYNKIVELGLI